MNQVEQAERREDRNGRKSEEVGRIFPQDEGMHYLVVYAYIRHKVNMHTSCFPIHFTTALQMLPSHILERKLQWSKQ